MEIDLDPVQHDSRIERMDPRIPVSITRQPCSSLGGLPPDVPWSGAMDDDAGLRAWIAELASGQ